MVILFSISSKCQKPKNATSSLKSKKKPIKSKIWFWLTILYGNFLIVSYSLFMTSFQQSICNYISMGLFSYSSKHHPFGGHPSLSLSPTHFGLPVTNCTNRRWSAWLKDDIIAMSHLIWSESWVYLNNNKINSEEVNKVTHDLAWCIEQWPIVPRLWRFHRNFHRTVDLVLLGWKAPGGWDRRPGRERGL